MARPDAARPAQLAAYRQRLLTFDTSERLFFRPATDYGADERLKPGVVARSGAQRKV